MNMMSKLEVQPQAIEFKLNGKTVTGFSNETLIQTAKRHGVEIPHLCYK